MLIILQNYRQSNQIAEMREPIVKANILVPQAIFRQCHYFMYRKTWRAKKNVVSSAIKCL